MHACMHGLTVVCVCVCGWVVRWTCLQGGAVTIYQGQGTFTNCNFTSNEASVSLEEEHVDGCEMSECTTLSLVPSMYIFLTDSLLLPLSVYCDCILSMTIGLDLTHFSATLLFFFFFIIFAFACTSAECKSFCYRSSHIFS